MQELLQVGVSRRELAFLAHAVADGIVEPIVVVQHLEGDSLVSPLEAIEADEIHLCVDNTPDQSAVLRDNIGCTARPACGVVGEVQAMVEQSRAEEYARVWAALSHLVGVEVGAVGEVEQVAQCCRETNTQKRIQA